MPSPHSYLSREHPVRLAHRGSTVLWPENTLEAFGNAAALGYRYVETDVRATRDGVVVVFHDADLDRLTNGAGRVADWDWEDLRLLDAAYHFAPAGGYPRRGTGARIPTLDEALSTFPDLSFNLDFKATRIEWALFDVIARRGRHDTTLVGSFRERTVRRFRRVSRGTVATAAGPSEAIAMWGASRAGRHVRAPAAAYQLPERAGPIRVDRRLVDACHEAGSQVHVWTVNEPGRMHRLLDLGVDGIVTDRPDLLNAVLEERGGAHG
jgi:glycerophosphoryl diester phosphodiesterase